MRNLFLIITVLATLQSFCQTNSGKGQQNNNTGTGTQNVYNNHKTSKKITINKDNQQINVTNNGTNNGIIAGVVVVPEDKSIPLADNFSVKLITDSAYYKRFSDFKYIFELKPRQGTWTFPIIAYPFDEDSLVHGVLTGNPFSGVTASTLGEIKPQNLTVFGKQVKMKFDFVQLSFPASPTNGVLFICKQKPSILIFGDKTDAAKQFLIRL